MYLGGCGVVAEIGRCLLRLRGGRNRFPMVGLANGLKAQPNIENSLKKIYYVPMISKIVV